MQNNFLPRYLLLFIIISLSFQQIKSATFYDISEEVSESTSHKKAEFSSVSTNVYYFKHSLSTVPDSQVTSLLPETCHKPVIPGFDFIIKS